MSNILVVFVNLSKGKDCQIKKAFTAVQRANLPCKLVAETDILQQKEKDAYLYVCDPFEGPAFEHLLKLQCRIVGPQCVLNCMRLSLAIPRSEHPVYNIAMKDVVISCTSIAKSQRQEIHHLVQWMGGIISRDFTENVTHLVAGEVGSKRYHVAVSLGKPVMLPEWVIQCWNHSKNRYVHATDEEFAAYQCPVFKGCVICVTGLESDKRRDVSLLTQEHGGTYSGELRQNKCTHLVVDEPKGQKYEFAKKWKIHCVTSKWFYDSLEKGVCLDENLYAVEDNVRIEQGKFVRPTSTPKRKSRQQTLSSIGDVSNISMASAINDTIMSVDLQTPSHENLFLDGCKIFLCGFTMAEVDRLQRIINLGGGSRFNQLKDSVSHVVMGTKDDNIIKMIQDSESRPYFLTAQWLVDSYTSGEKMEEQMYEYMTLTSVVEEDHGNTESLPKAKTKQRNSSVRESRVGVAVSHKEQEEDGDEDITLMEQYLPQNATVEIGNSCAGKNKSQEVDADETADNVAMEAEDADVTMELAANDADVAMEPSGNDVDVAMEPEDGNENQEDEEADETNVEGNNKVNQIFYGKTFIIVGFPDEQMDTAVEMITSHGGTFKPDKVNKMADFAIVPLIGCYDNVEAKAVINNCWLLMCIENECLIDCESNELFLPIDIPDDCKPLQNCVISISQFTGTERDCIQHLAEYLGAIVQDYFVRKANKGALANTHLILQEPSGSKYTGAVKWGLPAVDKRWLLECARQRQKVPEESYIIGNTRGEAEKTARIQTENQNRNNNRNEMRTSLPNEQVEQKSDGASNDVDRIKSITAKSDKEENTTVNNAMESKSNKQKNTAAPVHNAVPSTSGMDASFLSKKGYQPSFDFSDALAYLETPPSQRVKGSQRRRKSSLPLDVMFSNQMQKAVGRTIHSTASSIQTGQQQDNDEEEEVFHKQDEQGVLNGVIICVSKKVSKQQSEYNNLAESLGAEYIWTYDKTCTHFIYKGRNNDNSKEYKLAKEQGKYIVSPLWLKACQDENKHVDESLYPHTYNPKMSLTVSKKRRLTRASTRVQSNVGSSSDEEDECKTMATKDEEEVKETRDEDKEVEEEMPHTLEIQQDFKRQFEELKTTAMTNKSAKRKSRRLNNSSNTSNSGVHAQDQDHGNTDSASKTRSSRLQSSKNTFSDLPPEASQTLQITWDDPTGREERLKIMEKLQGGNSCHGDEDGEDDEEDGEGQDEEESHPQRATEDDEHNVSSTPEAPPVRLPSARPAVALAPEERKYKPPHKPRFLLSSMTQQEKIDYSGLIEELGGTVSETQYYDSTCTHVVVGTPTRNEKYLAALASGKWVLHKSYLEACRQAEEFVQEDEHEWGSGTDLTKLSAQTVKLALAATRWRQQLQEARQNTDYNLQVGAFEGWKVLLCVDVNREAGFKRLLEAGAAQVLCSRPPFSNVENATHAFLEINKIRKSPDLNVDIRGMAESNVLCLKPEYIAEYLMSESEPDADRYIIAEAKAFYQ
ncbi:DNA topoisomerase 2-binding protein 1-like isoform X2 [Ptychodera flava]